MTTSAGMAAARDLLESDWGWVLFPQMKLIKAAVDWLTSESEVSPAKQAEAAEKIIEAGRKHGAKRIKFKVDKSVGARLRGNVKGADVEASVGTDGKMEVEVEYKEDGVTTSTRGARRRRG